MININFDNGLTSDEGGRNIAARTPPMNPINEVDQHEDDDNND